MKNIKTALAALIIILLTVSCGKEDSPNQSSTFSVNPESIGFTRNSGSKSITVTCDGTWNASVSGSWASVSPTTYSGNGSVRVSVSANPDNKFRSCVVTISSGGESKEVSVLQKVTSK